MEIQELIKPSTTKCLDLADDIITPSEASNLLTALIDQKINFHKIQRLQKWEGNHNEDTLALDSCISKLEHERKTIQELVKQAVNTNKKLKAKGTFELVLVD